MNLKSLLGGMAITAVVASAQTPAIQTKAPAKPAQAVAGYKKEVPAKLAAKAKITEAAAAAIALAKVPGGKIEGVELEEEDGNFIYSYDIKVAGKSGVEEVHVDAMTGAVLKSVHEAAAAAGAEAEKAEKAKAPTKAKVPPPPVKKP